MSPTILVIITASIAAPKALILLKLLRERGFEIEVITTPSAEKFINVDEIEGVVGKKPYVELFSKDEMAKMNHINLSRKVDYVLVYPATANFLNKIAQGIADDLATSTILACNKDIAVAPAMNLHMWENQVTQDSITKLAERGVRVLGPNAGELACGEFGLGRLFEPEEVLSFLQDHFSLAKYVRGKKVVITAGATIEPLDPVRYISNFSSGKQGVALACYFKDLGADVVLVKGKTDCLVRQDLKIINVRSAQEMYDATFSELPADIVICAAAVADYRPELIAEEKIKKQDDDVVLIKLVKNPDILRDLGKVRDKVGCLVGFAAESQDLEKNALRKLEDKNCDVIVANNVAQGKIFGMDKTSVVFFSKTGASESHDEVKKSQLGSFLIKFLNS